MLPGAYHWIIHDDAAYLRWNSSGVAVVRLQADGKWRTWIGWQHRTHEGRAGNRDQAIRWVSRWVAAREDIPMAWPARRVPEKPAWALAALRR
jgi:hypothetical protein